MVKKVLARVFVYTLLFLMYAPIILLFLMSFYDTDYVSLEQLLSFDNISLNLYRELFAGEDGETVIMAFRNTFIVALSSAAVSTLLGSAGAIGIFYSKKRVRKTFELAGQIPILNPEIITAISLTILFVFIGVSFNFFTLMVGHVVLTLPFVVLSITPKLKQMDPNVYEAALDLGAKPSTALRKVLIPEILPGILAGFVLAVTLSLDDYIITAFTRNNSFETLSTYVYGITSKRGAIPPALRALSTVIFGATLLVLVLLNFRRPKNNSRKGRV